MTRSWLDWELIVDIFSKIDDKTSSDALVFFSFSLFKTSTKSSSCLIYSLSLELSFVTYFLLESSSFSYFSLFRCSRTILYLSSFNSISCFNFLISSYFSDKCSLSIFAILLWNNDNSSLWFLYNISASSLYFFISSSTVQSLFFSR